jgi:hypothetical protein
MHFVKHCAIAATSVLALTGLAVAADLTETEIKDLLVGKTVYVETLAGTSTGALGQGVIFYAPDGMAHFKTPKGELWQGKYTFKGNTLCTDWKQLPNNPCSRYDKQGDTINIVNIATGQARAKVAKTVAGNPEKLGQ